MSLEERKAIRLSVAAFRSMDSDGDGKLERDDIRKVLDNRIGELLNVGDVDSIVSAVQTADGKVSLNEFLYILAKIKEKEKEKD